MVINDKSQGSVASYLRCGGTSDYLLQIYCWAAEFTVKEF